MDRQQVIKKRVCIEKLVYGGWGLARTDAGIVFVSDVLPGENVDVVLDRTIAGQKIATPVAINQPSPHRRKPPCAHFGTCGGCDLLFSDYREQLSSKTEIFKECLTRIGKIADIPDCEVFPSPEFGYRRRAQFKVNKKQKAVGFYRRKSREIIPLRQCPLLQPVLNSLLTKTDEICTSISPECEQIKCIAGCRGEIASSPVLEACTVALTDILVGNHSFKVSGDSFFQGNAFLCEKLGAWGQQSVSGETFVDLYGGVGFFSIMLHRCFSKGVIIDSIGSQIELAHKNLRMNGISHIAARTCSAEVFLSEMKGSGPGIDCLFIDPPRTGLTPSVRQSILVCRPSMILYVSCNPSTQARDVGFLVGNAGYSLEKAALFDLYPNTHHLETVLVLRQ